NRVPMSRAAIIVVTLSAVSFGDNKELARTAFQEGTRLFDVGDYENALDAFKRAYVHYEEPAFLFNIGQCHRLLGHSLEGLRVYRTYLKRAPRAGNREAVERIVADLAEAVSSESRSRARPPQGVMEPKASAPLKEQPMPSPEPRLMPPPAPAVVA